MVPAVVTDSDRLPESQVATTTGQITLQLVQLQLECNSCTCDKYLGRNKNAQYRDSLIHRQTEKERQDCKHKLAFKTMSMRL